jgi:hypothetical protein
MSTDTTAKKTSFLTDAMYAVRDKMNGENVDAPETEDTPKRFAIKRIVTGVLAIGAVAATTAIIIAKTKSTASEIEEIDEDETAADS